MEASNGGRSPAEIIDSCGRQEVRTSEDFAPSSHTCEYFYLRDSNDVITPTSEPLMIFHIDPAISNDEETVKQFRVDKKLFVFGRIRYRSALHKERADLPIYETGWCFQYLPGFQTQDEFGQLRGMAATMIPAGGNEFNYHT